MKLSDLILMGLFLLTLAFAQVSSADEPDEGEGTPTDILTEEMDRIYGTLRFDDIVDELALRLNMQAIQSEIQPQQTQFNARVIAQFAAVRRAQEWLDETWKRKKLRLHSRKNPEDYGLIDLLSEDAPPPKVRKNPWNLSLDTRVDYHRKIRGHIHLRLRRDIKTRNWVNSISLDGGWSTANQWEARFGTSSHHALSEYTLFTWDSSFHRFFSQIFLSSSHGPSLAWSLAENQALSLSTLVNLTEAKGFWAVRSYSISSEYRWECSKNKLFVTINPFIHFIEENDFQRDAGMRLTAELTL